MKAVSREHSVLTELAEFTNTITQLWQGWMKTVLLTCVEAVCKNSGKQSRKV